MRLRGHGAVYRGGFEPPQLGYCLHTIASHAEMAVGQNQWWCTTHFRTYFSGDWDVHWGVRAFDKMKWPNWCAFSQLDRVPATAELQVLLSCEQKVSHSRTAVGIWASDGFGGFGV